MAERAGRRIASLSLSEDGAQLFQGAAAGLLRPLAGLFDRLGDRPGLRLADAGALTSALAAEGVIGSLASAAIGDKARPVRLLLFDKSAERNWALGWHQDRTICVRERHETAGFGPWTVKQGLDHVVPPYELIERMITLRIHLDPVSDDNGPLKLALKSHTMGTIREIDKEAVLANLETLSCLAQPGDVWANAASILHASDSATGMGRRRLLQVDYSADTLPNPLEWLQ